MIQEGKVQLSSLLLMFNIFCPGLCAKREKRQYNLVSESFPYLIQINQLSLFPLHTQLPILQASWSARHAALTSGIVYLPKINVIGLQTCFSKMYLLL